MSTGEKSILAKKIAGSGQANRSTPDLEKFYGLLARRIGESVSELLDGEVAATIDSAGICLKEALSAAPEFGAYYWLLDHKGARCGLINVSPGFCGVVTERLLGGALEAPKSETASSLLDFGMAEALAEILTPAIVAALQKSAPASAMDYRFSRQSAQARADMLRDLEPVQAYRATVNLSFAEHQAAGAIDIFFMTDFLKKTGLTETRKARPTAAAREAALGWSAQLRRNILNTGLPISVVLDRLQSNVGAMSMLQVGQIIDINPDALSRLELSVMTTAGPASLARGRLGAFQTKKAVKLAAPIDADFLRGL